MKTPPAPARELPCDAALGKRVLVAGCGYLGRVVARELHMLGWDVTGITRSLPSAQALQEEPFRVLACDIGDRAALAALGSFDAVIACASSGWGDVESYRKVYLEGTQNLLEVLHPEHFIFTGSTSVYAQTDGTVVTEESPAQPARETGQMLRAAEEVTLAAGGTVARLAGIYGPGRWALLSNFLDGNAVLEGDGSRWINQIHRADAASALVFLLSIPPGIYNVSDGTPATQREIYTAFSEHYQRPLPPTGPLNTTRKRGYTHKQVSHAKLRALGWSPMYPSFREALR
ncbi:MAG: NAD-dependent epimerase/dehydratase family protein [Verrucomicrobia bacterium]|nr:NAD-dependent epimerase/dehydratase family protein [Verrucomicrobiota bacterium]